MIPWADKFLVQHTSYNAEVSSDHFSKPKGRQVNITKANIEVSLVVPLYDPSQLQLVIRDEHRLVRNIDLHVVLLWLS